SVLAPPTEEQISAARQQGRAEGMLVGTAAYNGASPEQVAEITKRALAFGRDDYANAWSEYQEAFESGKAIARSLIGFKIVVLSVYPVVADAVLAEPAVPQAPAPKSGAAPPALEGQAHALLENQPVSQAAANEAAGSVGAMRRLEFEDTAKHP